MKVEVRVPLVVAEVDFDREIEMTQVSFNQNHWEGIIDIVPPNIGFKSRRFRVTIEALDVSARLEGDGQ